MKNSASCRRWIFIVFTLCVTLLGGLSDASAQNTLPPRSDDLDYAKKLSATGFEDLAIDIYERIFADPGLTPQKKQEIGRLLVETYRRLASKAADSAVRDRYLGLAEQRLKDVSAEVTTLSPEMRYQKAQVLQTQGLSIARDVKSEQNADRKKAMIDDGAKSFDECGSILETLAAENKAAGDAAARGVEDVDERAKRERPFRDMEVKCRHQRGWTWYYKAQLWDKGSPEYKKNMEEAVKVFGKFIEDYPTQMLMLSAKYGRGLAERLIEKPEDAKKDFSEIVAMIDQAGVIAEVMPLKARCAFQWAELAIESGDADNALVAVDKELAENASVEADPELLTMGWMTKAKALAAKAEKAKAAGKADDASKSWKESIDLLGKVMEKGGSNSFEARELLAKYVASSGMKDLDAESRVALATGYIVDKKYKEAVDELRKVVDSTSANVPPASAFKAQRMLAVCYRLTGQLKQAVSEFDSLFRRFAGKVAKEDLAKAMQDRCATLGALAKQDASPASDQAYVAAWKQFATEYPDTPEGRDAAYYYAQALQERSGTVEAWQATADAYAKVSEQSGFYGKARYLEGVCWYNVYKIYSTRKEQSKPEAQAALNRAVETLKSLFDKLPPPKPGDDWHVDAARTLADIYLDLGKPDDALGVVDFVKKKYPNLAAGNAKLLSTLVDIYTRQGKLDEAATLLTEIGGKSADPGAMVQAYMRLGDAFQKKGDERSKAGSADDARKANARAAEMFENALPLVRPGVEAEITDPGRAAERAYRLYSWLANRSYLVKGYATCAKAIDAIEQLYTDAGREADDALWQLRIRKLRCFQQGETWPPEAVTLLTQLETQFPNVAEIKSVRATLLESKNEWEPALAIWDYMATALKAGSADQWEANYHRCLCNYKLGRKAVANDIIDKLRTLTPSMGGAEMKERFDKLYEQHGK